MPKVFIVQETDRNVESARQHGDISVLLSYKDSKLPIDEIEDILIRRLGNVHKRDFILCIGDPICIGLACHVALSYTEGKLNFLKWDKVQMKYLAEKLG